MVTQNPREQDGDDFNIGIYRMQVTGPDTTLMRWLKHRGGAQAHAAQMAAQGAVSTEPLPAAVVIGVADLARTLAVLRAAGIDVQAAKSATIWVPADAANGAVIAFTQAPRTGPRQC